MRVFIRRSGAPLTDGVPGFYTVDGFYKVLLPTLPAATTQVASESWVLGKAAQIDPASPQVLTLQRDVIALYTADYAKQWDALLADLDIAPMRSLQQAVQDLYILASPQSPMRDLLAGITRQLTLTQPPPPPPGVAGAVQGAAQAAGAAAAQAASGAAARLQTVFGQAAGPPPEPPGKAIEDRYAALIAFVGKGPGAPIDSVLKLLNDICRRSSPSWPRRRSAAPAAALGGRRGSGAGAAGRGNARDPQPVARWLQAMATERQPAARRRGAASRSRRRSARPAGRRRCAARRSPAAIRSMPAPATTFRWTISPGCSRRAGCSTSSSTTTCSPSSIPPAPPGRRSRWPA